MLFNTYGFIFIFLPVTLILFFLVGNRGHYKSALVLLVAASLFFYGWWNPAYLFLISVSILFNFSVGQLLGKYVVVRKKKRLLFIGIAVNILALAYFKYFNFFIENINSLFGSEFNFENIILPLAISFFTFQQITYLADTYRGKTQEYSFLQYCLFVTFFPQLIAGPIVHHQEMMPQFAKKSVCKLKYKNLVIGITIFVLGLFKKVIIADGFAPYATSVFHLANDGVTLNFFEAWAGALAYTFQLYFDFSGYSDMAIGLARMFGIKLPVNFNSPYKATNIIDFWRRWHITLSRFLQSYVYIPLGGNRKGKILRANNLMITMLLGGLWHGAGWNFVLWGALHGIYLMINHGWRILFPIRQLSHLSRRIFAWSITFLAVVMAWVPFRAETLDGVKSLWSSMLGFNGISLPNFLAGKLGTLENGLIAIGMNFNGTIHNSKAFVTCLPYFVPIFLLLLLLPNTQQFMSRYYPVIKTQKTAPGYLQSLQWRASATWAAIIAFVFAFTVLNLSQPSEFLYFQF